MLIVQERQKKKGILSKITWIDVFNCKTTQEAKEYIKKEFLKKNKKAESFRVITSFVRCKTKVEFDEDLAPEVIKNKSDNTMPECKAPDSKETPATVDKTTKPFENVKKEVQKTVVNKKEIAQKPKKSKKINRAPKNLTEDDLKLLFFERSCELKRWAKTLDFENNVNRDKYPCWATFNQHIGSIGNIIDMIFFELKKEPVSLRYQELINKYFGEDLAGICVIKKLAAGRNNKK